MEKSCKNFNGSWNIINITTRTHNKVTKTNYVKNDFTVNLTIFSRFFVVFKPLKRKLQLKKVLTKRLLIV